MQSNLLHTDQHQTNAGYLKKCGFCSRSNPAVARFCGGCGRSTRFSIIEKVSQVDAAPPISKPTIKPKQRKTFFRGRTLRQLVARHKTVASSFLLAVIFSMSGFLFFTQRPVSIGETAEWVDFRAFLARKLEIPHPELNSVFSQLFSRPADDMAKIDQEKAACFESYFQRTFGQPGLSLFPNPFFAPPRKCRPRSKWLFSCFHRCISGSSSLHGHKAPDRTRYRML